MTDERPGARGPWRHRESITCKSRNTAFCIAFAASPDSSNLIRWTDVKNYHHHHHHHCQGYLPPAWFLFFPRCSQDSRARNPGGVGGLQSLRASHPSQERSTQYGV